MKIFFSRKFFIKNIKIKNQQSRAGGGLNSAACCLAFSMLNVLRRLYHFTSGFNPPIIVYWNYGTVFNEHLSDLKLIMRLEILLLPVTVLEEFEAILFSTLERTSTTTGVLDLNLSLD